MVNISLDGRFLAVNVTPNPCPRHVCLMSVTMLMTIAEEFRWIECYILIGKHFANEGVLKIFEPALFSVDAKPITYMNFFVTFM